MFNKILAALCILSLFSCKSKIYTDEIDRNKFCQYFNIKTELDTVAGVVHKSVSLKINEIPNDKVSDYIQDHISRFDYIIDKTLSKLIKDNKIFRSNSLDSMFCNAISTDEFYKNFALLTSGDRTKKGGEKKTFTIPELMKIASRFFMCDRINEKDTGIGYHICVGINGISELKTTKDYTVLEAFCFEAIGKNISDKGKIIGNFHSYIKKASREGKQNFTSFQEHLKAVKEKCYADMEKDKELEKGLMKYYNRNRENIDFRIE